MSIILLVVALFGATATDAYALRAYESRLSKNRLLIVVGDEEAKRVAHDKSYRMRLGEEAASKALRVVGLPSSLTGKAAAMTTAIPLAQKYGLDIERYARKYKQGFTLQYHVNIQGLRQLFSAAEIGDILVPGGPGVSAVNTLVNAMESEAPRK
jgi:hypothetical protein